MSYYCKTWKFKKRKGLCVMVGWMHTQSSSSVLCAQAEPESRPILQTQKRAREPARAKYLGRRESHFCAQCQHTTLREEVGGFQPFSRAQGVLTPLTASAAGDTVPSLTPPRAPRPTLLPQDTQHHGFQPLLLPSHRASWSSRITFCGPASGIQ